MKYLKINVPHVVHEIFSDDEAAIINLKTGNYYSLNPTGADIWAMIEQNLASDEIVEAFSRTFKNKSAVDSVRKFVGELLQEDLVVEIEARRENGSGESNLRYEKADRKFIEPEMEKFGDMQELLLLDPIHDVEETGFPHKKAQKALS